MPGLVHVALLRSPFAHAHVVAIDVSAAQAAPGVVAVVTQADLDERGVRKLGHLLSLPGLQPLEWGVLAQGTVRFVGEPLFDFRVGFRRQFDGGGGFRVGRGRVRALCAGRNLLDRGSGHLRVCLPECTLHLRRPLQQNSGELGDGLHGVRPSLLLNEGWLKPRMQRLS